MSVESLIRKEQLKDYKVLEKCDKLGESTLFIEFSLELILSAIEVFAQEFRPRKKSANDRVSIAIETFGGEGFSRKDYLNLHKDISIATASRDLAKAVEEGTLQRFGDKALARYIVGEKMNR